MTKIVNIHEKKDPRDSGSKETEHFTEMANQQTKKLSSEVLL